MGGFDPVPWDEIENAVGPPAPDVTDRVEQLQEEVRGKTPYVAVKTIHDTLSEDETDPQVPGLGEPFITAYLLEKSDALSRDEAVSGDYPSLLERRPGSDRLVELFWERERTLWWIGIPTGVHPSLVTYWLYEDDIPLMERNLTADSMEQIRSYRDSNRK